jgi:hypothetical protein
MKEVMLKYAEKILWLVLLAGLFLYYPGKLIYNFVTGYLAVFVAKLEMFEGVEGIKELVVIDGLAALILGGVSILCAWHIFKKHEKSKLIIFSFLSLTLVYYLMEPLWLRIAGFPVEIFEGRLYEKPLDLLRPIGAALLFGIYFFISGRNKAAANKGPRAQ